MSIAIIFRPFPISWCEALAIEYLTPVVLHNNNISIISVSFPHPTDEKHEQQKEVSLLRSCITVCWSVHSDTQQNVPGSYSPQICTYNSLFHIVKGRDNATLAYMLIKVTRHIHQGLLSHVWTMKLVMFNLGTYSWVVFTCT